MTIELVFYDHRVRWWVVHIPTARAWTWRDRIIALWCHTSQSVHRVVSNHYGTLKNKIFTHLNKCYKCEIIVFTLKQKCCHFDKIFITDCTGSCQNDNFQCSRWWKFQQNDNISVSVYPHLLSRLAHISKHLALRKIFYGGDLRTCDQSQAAG